jgi:hypothetical protein
LNTALAAEGPSIVPPVLHIFSTDPALAPAAARRAPSAIGGLRCVIVVQQFTREAEANPAMLSAFVKRHPIWSAILSFLLIPLPQWASAVWSLFSSEPLFVVLRRNYGQNIASVFRWSPVAIGLSLLVAIFIIVTRARLTEHKRSADNEGLPATRPIIVPKRFGGKRKNDMGYTGLGVVNDGAATAYEVSPAPEVVIERAGRTYYVNRRY